MECLRWLTNEETSFWESMKKYCYKLYKPEHASWSRSRCTVKAMQNEELNDQSSDSNSNMVDDVSSSKSDKVTSSAMERRKVSLI